MTERDEEQQQKLRVNINHTYCEQGLTTLRNQPRSPSGGGKPGEGRNVQSTPRACTVQSLTRSTRTTWAILLGDQTSVSWPTHRLSATVHEGRSDWGRMPRRLTIAHGSHTHALKAHPSPTTQTHISCRSMPACLPLRRPSSSTDPASTRPCILCLKRAAPRLRPQEAAGRPCWRSAAA